MILFFRTPSKSVIATQVDHQLDSNEINELCWLFGDAVLEKADSLEGFFVGPRREMITPWSTNAVEITQNMNLHGISRIEEYARLNASVGINGAVLDNVNASPKVLTTEYLDTVKAIADIMRPYGVRVYLAINFASPMALGATSTADPLDSSVKAWWKAKAKEIYALIPDFGGFLVKANSEGQPGPGDYHRSHADGANMLADALKPYGGTVIWRSFVYGANHKGEDRVMQAVEVEVTLVGDRPCGGDVPQEKLDALIARADSAVRELFDAEPIHGPSSTDANIPLAAGIPAICVSAAVGRGCHTRQEEIDLDQLPNGAKLSMRLMQEYFEI